MSKKGKGNAPQPKLTVDGEVIRQIRQHARANSKTEVCGVLIGKEEDGGLRIQACIAGLKAAQAGTHVTFTQDTWEHIYKIKDERFPDARIVGWYHSHPGFGVFLSDHDTFIHKNFFSSPFQVAWVYDPHSDEEGCFGWAGERLERLSQIAVKDHKGGEEAGESGKPEPVGAADDEEMVERKISDKPETEPQWVRSIFWALTHVTLLLVGFLISWFLFPRVLVWPIDASGRPMIERPVDMSTLEKMIEDAKSRSTQPAPGKEGGKEQNVPQR